MRRKVIQSALVPAGPGAGSHAISVAAERTLYLGGMLPEARSFDTRTQCRQVLERARLVLEAAGLRLEDLDQVTLYLVDLEDLATFDEVYAPVLLRPPPARSVIGVAALPDGARVMMDGIASG